MGFVILCVCALFFLPPRMWRVRNVAASWIINGPKAFGKQFSELFKRRSESSKIPSPACDFGENRLKVPVRCCRSHMCFLSSCRHIPKTLPSQPSFNHHRRHLEVLGADVPLQRQCYDTNNNAKIISPLIMQWSGLFYNGLKWERAKSSHPQIPKADGWHSSLYSHLKTRHRVRQVTLSAAQVINGTLK